MPGDVDRFAFQARKGHKSGGGAGARGLIPYLADAVPGWFQAVLAACPTIRATSGVRQLLRVPPGPGDLLRDAPGWHVRRRDPRRPVSRAGGFRLYAITLGELPYVTSIFPLGGRAGTATVVEVKGWNLSAGKVKVDARPGSNRCTSVCVHGPDRTAPTPTACRSPSIYSTNRGSGTQRYARHGPGGRAADHRQRAYRSAGRRRLLPLRGRGGTVWWPRSSPAGSTRRSIRCNAPERRLGPGTGGQRRL